MPHQYVVRFVCMCMSCTIAMLNLQKCLMARHELSWIHTTLYLHQALFKFFLFILIKI